MYVIALLLQATLKLLDLPPKYTEQSLQWFSPPMWCHHKGATTTVEKGNFQFCYTEYIPGLVFGRKFRTGIVYE